MVPQDVVRRLHECPSQVRISSLADPQLGVCPSRLIPLRSKSEIRAHAPTARKPLRVLDRHHVRKRRDRSYAGDLTQSRRLRISLPTHLIDLAVESFDPSAQLRDHSEDRLEPRKHVAQFVALHSLREVLRVAPRQALAE